MFIFLHFARGLLSSQTATPPITTLTLISSINNSNNTSNSNSSSSSVALADVRDSWDLTVKEKRVRGPLKGALGGKGTEGGSMEI